MKGIYIMACGCKLSKESLVQRNGGYECQDHPGAGVASIRRKCKDCQEILTLAPKQWSKIRCDACRKKRKRMLTNQSKSRRNGSDEKLNPIRVAEELAAENTWDCIHRGECLDKAVRQKQQILPCVKCNRYASGREALA